MTVKITGFTCVLIPNVVRLYFWQSKTEKIAKLVLSAIKILSKGQSKYCGNNNTGKTCTLTVKVCSVGIGKVWQSLAKSSKSNTFSTYFDSVLIQPARPSHGN